MHNENTASNVTGLRAFLGFALFALALLIMALPAQAAPLVSAPVLAQVDPAGAVAAPVLPADMPLADKVVAFLIPVLVPLVLAAAKKFLPKMPSWALPLLAPVLGFLIGVIQNLASTHSSNLWLAAGLGLLDVGDVRNIPEIKGTKFEARAVLEPRFYVLDTVTESTGYIKTVNLTGP